MNLGKKNGKLDPGSLKQFGDMISQPFGKQLALPLNGPDINRPISGDLETCIYVIVVIVCNQ